MSFDEFSRRLFPAIVFAALAAAGLGLMMGFQSGAIYFALIVGVCVLFGIMQKSASVAAIGLFGLGLALWLGLVPRDLTLTAALDKARTSAQSTIAAAPSIAPSRTEVPRAGSLVEQLEQLAIACQKSLLTETECKSGREAVMEKFKATP